MSFTSISIGLKELLRDPVRRQEFFKSITQDDIASQIRDLRKRRKLTQASFAAKSGMKQSAVSRIEQAEYSSWSLATLLKVAAALDARWRIILQPAEEAMKEYETLEEKPKPLISSGRSALDDLRPDLGSLTPPDDDGQASIRIPDMPPPKSRQESGPSALRAQ